MSENENFQPITGDQAQWMLDHCRSATEDERVVSYADLLRTVIATERNAILDLEDYQKSMLRCATVATFYRESLDTVCSVGDRAAVDVAMTALAHFPECEPECSGCSLCA